MPEDAVEDHDPGGQLGHDELVDAGPVADDVVQRLLDELRVIDSLKLLYSTVDRVPSPVLEIEFTNL